MKWALVVLASLACCSCDVPPDRDIRVPYQPSRVEAVADVGNLLFIRHTNGMCFGVVRFMTYGREGVSITHVPSEACK